MTDKQPPGYADYLAETAFHATYSAYQERYKQAPRESDRVLIDLITGHASTLDRPARILDVGCSTGNLLSHLHARLPDAHLHGIDPHTDTSRNQERLTLERVDLFDYTPGAPFDMVVFNAVLCLFNDQELGLAIGKARALLERGGLLAAFDYVHGYKQELEVTERSPDHPAGMTLNMRSGDAFGRALEEGGFSDVVVTPFRIGIDLAGGVGSVIGSRTVLMADGERLVFRGALFQPWAHVTAVAV